MNKMYDWFDKNWLDIMAVIMITVVLLFVTFWGADAQAHKTPALEFVEGKMLDGEYVCIYETIYKGNRYWWAREVLTVDRTNKERCPVFIFAEDM